MNTTSPDGVVSEVGEHRGEAQHASGTGTNAVQVDLVEVWVDGGSNRVSVEEFKRRLAAGEIGTEVLCRRAGSTLFLAADQVARDLAEDARYRAAVERVGREGPAVDARGDCGAGSGRSGRRGSGGNVLAALASFVVPGLGQLAQGRVGAAALAFVGGLVFWVVALGWVVHIAAAVEAARWDPPFSDFRF